MFNIVKLPEGMVVSSYTSEILWTVYMFLRCPCSSWCTKNHWNQSTSKAVHHPISGVTRNGTKLHPQLGGFWHGSHISSQPHDRRDLFVTVVTHKRSTESIRSEVLYKSSQMFFLTLGENNTRTIRNPVVLLQNRTGLPRKRYSSTPIQWI